MKTSLSFLPFILLLLLTACQSDDDATPNADAGSGDVKIRIENSTSYDFKSVNVIPIDEEHQYGDLDAGAISEYYGFEKAYRYGYVKLEIEGREFIAQPIDFIGETLLDDGEYTWEISVIDFANGYLSVQQK